MRNKLYFLEEAISKRTFKMAKQPAAEQVTLATPATVGCCPQLEPCQVCDVLNFTYRLPFRAVVGDQQQVVPVEVTLHYRLTRCQGPARIGRPDVHDDALAGRESAALFKRPSHAIQLRQRIEAVLPQRDDFGGIVLCGGHGLRDEQSQRARHDNASSSFSSSSVSGGGGVGIDFGIFSIGGGASGSSYDANSASALAHSLSQHAESLHQHMEVSTRAAASTSIGEVSTRAHQQDESEDQYESASRPFSNPNHCHALTFLNPQVPDRE